MNQIILASHGGLSAGMRDTVELIVGEVPNVHVVSTTRDEREPILAATRRLLKSFDPEDRVYILTDVLSGSVNNDMLTLLADWPDLTILCGMNACLALNLASTDDPISDEELEDFLQQARDQILNCSKLIGNSNMEEDDL